MWRNLNLYSIGYWVDPDVLGDDGYEKQNKNSYILIIIENGNKAKV